MAISEAERRILDTVSLDAPWALVEAFSVMPRWLPEDVNKGADRIAQSLERLGVPVTMHQPEIYLSIPLRAEVRVGGKSYRAKPPSMSISAPQGIEGPLVYLEADPEKFRSYTRDPAEIFRDGTASGPESVRGKVALIDGFANPGSCSLLEEWGAKAVIAINPGVDIHWGTCTTVWGSPDLDDLPRKPTIPVVAVNNPDGREIMAAARTRGSASVVTEMMEGWYPQKIPVVDIPGATEPGRFVFVHGHYDSWDVGVGDNATGDATLLEIARVLWSNRDGLRRSVRIAWWPGHSTGRYAGSTWFADAFAIDLDENCVAQINCDSPGCRWATSYHQTTCMAEARPHVSRAIEDVTGQAPQFKRPEPGRGLLVQQHRDLELLHALLDDARRPSGREELLCGVGLRREHRLAHRERHDRDRRPDDPRHRHPDLPALDPPSRQCRDPAGRLASRDRGVRGDARLVSAGRRRPCRSHAVAHRARGGQEPP